MEFLGFAFIVFIVICVIRGINKGKNERQARAVAAVVNYQVDNMINQANSRVGQYINDQIFPTWFVGYEDTSAQQLRATVEKGLLDQGFSLPTTPKGKSLLMNIALYAASAMEDVGGSFEMQCLYAGTVVQTVMMNKSADSFDAVFKNTSQY